MDSREHRQELFIRLWIYSIGLLSAYVNMLGLMNFTYAVSNCTGNFVDIFYDTSLLLFERVHVLIVCSLLFIVGGVIAALINQNRDFDISHNYGVAQAVTGILLWLVYRNLYANPELFIFSLSLLMGVQNSLIRSYRGAMFKPAHVTTSFSELGQYIGDHISGAKDSKWKITFQLNLLVAFAAGTLLSLITYDLYGAMTFLFASIGYIAMGIVYLILQLIAKNRIEGT